MSAQNNLSSPQFDPYEDDWQRDDYPDPVEQDWNPAHLFHGTAHSFSIGDSVEPGHPSNWTGDTHDSRGKNVFATTSPRDAWEYAKKAAVDRPGSARVYEVSHGGDITPDPEYASSEFLKTPVGWKSRAGFTVTGNMTRAARRSYRNVYGEE